MNKKGIIIFLIVFFTIILFFMFMYLYKINKQKNKDLNNIEEIGNSENDKIDINSINIKIPQLLEMPEEIRKYIQNYDDFVYKIKEFIYHNKIQNATVASYKDYNIINKYRVYIFLELNNQEKDEIGIVIDNTTAENKIYVAYKKEIYTHEYSLLQIDESGYLVYPDGVSVNGIDFKVENIPEEVSKYFSEFNSYLSGFKSYIFMHGLNKNATIATFQSYEYNKQKKEITMYFYLNDTNKTKITTIFNFETESMNFIY